MVDILGGKIQDLIMNNEDMLTWFQEWTRIVVDKQTTSLFALWKDETKHQMKIVMPIEVVEVLKQQLLMV